MKNHLQKKISALSILVMISFNSFAQSASTEESVFVASSVEQKVVPLDSLGDIMTRETIQYSPYSYIYYKNGELHKAGLFAGKIKKELSKSKEALQVYKEHLKLNVVSRVLMTSAIVGCGAMLTIVASPIAASAVGIAVIGAEVVSFRAGYLAQKKLLSALSIYNKQMVVEAANKCVK